MRDPHKYEESAECRGPCDPQLTHIPLSILDGYGGSRGALGPGVWGDASRVLRKRLGGFSTLQVLNLALPHQVIGTSAGPLQGRTGQATFYALRPERV